MELNWYIPWLKLSLNLFDGEGASGGADGAADAGEQGGDDPVSLPEHKGRRKNPLANVRYGIQPDGGNSNAQAEGAGQDDAAKEGTDERAEWEALKKGRFAKYYGEDVGNTVRDRLKNSKANEETLSKLQPVLEQMARRSGKDIGDIDGLVASYMDDDSLYEEEAVERGIPVKTLKAMKQLERSNAQFREQQAHEEQQRMFDEHIARLEQQG